MKGKERKMKGRESGQRTCELGQNVIVQEFGQEEETCRSDVESSPSVPFTLPLSSSPRLHL